MESEERLCEQLRFYRASAASYAAWNVEVFERGGGGSFGELCRRDRARALTDLRGLAPLGRALELAAGTGSYTRDLLTLASSVTAVDASPESLALARGKLTGGSAPVTFVEADIFRWRPDRRYDTVFFAYWLSHVPESRFTSFWEVVADALAPGGRAFLIDSTGAQSYSGPSGADDSGYRETDDLANHTSRRELDGRAWQVVKVARSPAELTARLAELGWRARLDAGEHSLWGCAVRS